MFKDSVGAVLGGTAFALGVYNAGKAVNVPQTSVNVGR